MGSQVKFGLGKHGFQSYRICSFLHLSTDLDGEKNRICMANAKIKKVRTYIASEIPKDKTHVLRNAIFFSIFKIWFFSRTEIEILSEKLALFSSFFAHLLT